MTIQSLFDSLPKSERTFIKRMQRGQYSVKFKNVWHPCEYECSLPDGTRGMVKYYQGRKLACYQIA